MREYGRPIQKMIEYLSNAHQIRTLINALAMNVVTLIKDLNGNHVIQKCLNKLSAEQNQVRRIIVYFF